MRLTTLGSLFFWLLLAARVGLPAATGESRPEETTFRGIGYEVVRVDPTAAEIRLRWRDENGRPLRTLKRARELAQADGAVFLLATNSGIYDKSGAPLGLHIEKGQILRRLNRSHASHGNFFMDPNGVFGVRKNGQASVIDARSFSPESNSFYYATQSGPLLVKAGVLHPAFHADSANFKLRSGVGVTKTGAVIFAISKAGVSFFDFALFFRDELGCPNALYLDGQISSFLRGQEPPREFAEFAGIWTVVARRKKL